MTALRGISALVVAVSGSVLYLIVQFGLVMGAPLPEALMWGLFAFFGMSSTLLTGRVNTALNMLIFTAAFLLQWLLGLVLKSLTDAGYEAGSAHTTVMAAILAAEVAALLWLMWGRRTPRRS